MNIYNPPVRKVTEKIMKQTSDIYLQPNARKKNTGHYVPNRTRHANDTIKTINRNSIQIPIQPKNTPNCPPNYPSKSIYKRISHNFRKGISQRYEQIQVRDIRNKDRNSTTDPRHYSKSPYLRKQTQERNSLLNYSTHKIKSGNLKQLSPYNHKQPKSSLSQHYEPQSNAHKRRVSLVAESRKTLLQEAKEYYRQNNFDKSKQILNRYVKTHRIEPQGHYLLGMSLINSNQLSLGIDQLLETIALDPNYKKGIYLVLALAYKKINYIDEAIQILTKGINTYADYYDCLVYRGKMFMKKQQYVTAKRDFIAAIESNPKKGFAYVGKGTCQKEMGSIEEAIRTFTDGLKSDMDMICYEKRANCYLQSEKYELAMKDIQKCGQGGAYSTSYHLTRGRICYKLKKYIDAMLNFQECLKYDTNSDNITCSIETMIKIKIQDKDFYEAYHILCRANSMDVCKDVMYEWRLFIQGSLFLMKKKFKDGINNLEELLNLPNYKNKYKCISNKRIKQRYQFIKPLIHLYKAFGELSENNQQQSEDDYAEHSKVCADLKKKDNNLSKMYNLMIISAYKNFPEKSLHFIQEASKLINSKPEPYLYLVFDKVQNQLCKKNTNDKHTQQNNCLEQILNILSKGILFLPQLSNNHISCFYYYRAIIYFFKNEFNKAVADIDKAIEKSEDNIPKYFNMRGMIFSCFGNFSQGIQDFSVAINLDQKYAKPYLQRAKCLQIEGNSNQAFLDLQKYITLVPQDPYIHKYAGFLLFQNCAYEDCLSAFTHGIQLQNDYQLILAKAKAYFLLGGFDESLNLFNEYKRKSNSSDYMSDTTIISICKSIQSSTTTQQYHHYLQQMQDILTQKTDDDCKIFKFRDIYQLKGTIYLLMQQYQSAIQNFKIALQLFQKEKKTEMEKHFIEDEGQFQDQWSEIEIKYNMSLCYSCLSMYSQAQALLEEFEKSQEKGKNWQKYLSLIEDLKKGQNKQTGTLDVFEQNHRISRNWPLISIPKCQKKISLAFSYPFVEPPEMMPQFDESIFKEFTTLKVQIKPQAPWINRSDNGLVFTPNVEMYDNLQLSITTKNNEESDKDKPVSEMQQSLSLNESDFQMETEELKKKFKLDSLIEMKLQKLIRK